jgi:hypothetical protein
MSRPPLGLIPEVVDQNGTRHRWNAVSAQDTPQAIGFRTLRGTGHADLPGITLSRRIDRDYVDIGLYHDINLIGADGSPAYEGRISATPRSLDGGHTVTVQGVGWMAHAQDDQLVYLGVEQDFAQWSDMPLNERIRLAHASKDMGTQWGVTALDGLALSFPAGTLGADAAAETWYVAPSGERIGAIAYVGANAGGASGTGLIGLSDADSGPGETYIPTLNGQLHKFDATTARRFAYVAALPPAGTVIPPGWLRHFAKLAVYGNHGLPTRRALAAGEPDGLYVSDVIRDVFSRYCPKLSTAGVKDTRYPVGQIVYRDLISPYDLLLDLNKFHMWLPAVYGKTLQYAPYDLSDYDWDVRLGDPGVKIDLQGDTADNLANAVRVQFTNIATGRVEILSPDDYPELRDPAVENPATAHGLKKSLPFSVSFPCSLEDALQFGRAALAEANQPTGSGTIVLSGYARDRAGHLQPTHKVRAHDRIAITTHPNARPRLIVETNYNHGSGNTPPSVTIGVDSTLKRLESLFDRVLTAQAAHNIR